MATTLDYPKLPPLKALKGFESTARLGSFRKAAEELKLTHPAISHQVQSLEKNLGGGGKEKIWHRQSLVLINETSAS